jgi:PilZ domain-containing protein
MLYPKLNLPISEGSPVMSQIFEALRKAEAIAGSRVSESDLAEIVERRRSGRRCIAAQIRIYGHGQGSSPFFEENSILNASQTGALLLMKTPVVAGQKLLLINEASEQVQECRVVRTSCCDSRQLEVAVEFSTPQPEFWTRLGEQPKEGGIEKRRSPRVVLPKGMTITWRAGDKSVVSRVQTISAGGLSIAAHDPPSKGELLHLWFEVPAGEISAQAVVRHSRHGQDMGVEFVAMPEDSRAHLERLLEKLLG